MIDSKAPPQSAAFAAALVAGGRSTRMGRDKGWLDWHGQPLWQFQLAKLQSLGAAPVLLACREEQNFLEPNAEPVFDPAGDTSGPLGAVLRCLERVQRPLLVLAVDMPWMTADFLRRDLLQRCPLPRGLFYQRGGRIEPLAGIYPPEMEPLLRRALRAGQLSLQSIIGQAGKAGMVDLVEMTAAQLALFRNGNAPADWSP